MWYLFVVFAITIAGGAVGFAVAVGLSFLGWWLSGGNDAYVFMLHYSVPVCVFVGLVAGFVLGLRFPS